MRRSKSGNHHRASEAGFTFAELALGLLVLVTIASVMISHLTVNLSATVNERDRLYAFGKAQAILAEIQCLVDDGDGSSDSLDALDDGIVNKDALTIMRDDNGEFVLPDHPVSGNYQRAGDWVWSRRITVQPFSGIDNRNVRYVTVRVFQRNSQGQEREVADVSAVVSAAGAAFPTTQVFDLYLIAIENIPGWWVFMDSIRPFVESTITDLETRNPGLEVRTHWITQSSYGRDQAYRPYVNEAQDSLQTISEVYHYPGRMPAGSASTYYYVPHNIKARISQDGDEVGGYEQATNPHPYALCDFFNHSVRYPDEVRLYNQRVADVTAWEQAVADAAAAGQPAPTMLHNTSKEPTLRLFLEDLNRNPDRFKNALIVNLHGELLPVPALRNYSDAAKLPDHPELAEVRVVTHPERLRTPRDNDPSESEDAAFRVYAYNTNTDEYEGPDRIELPIAVEVMGVNLTDPSTPAPDVLSQVNLEYLQGGVSVEGDNTYFTDFRDAKVEGDPSIRAGEMYYSAQFVANGAESFTRILLYNTPCVAPFVDTRGLRDSTRAQLYGMAYQPSPCGNEGTFDRNLGSTGSRPKNTARWRFEVPRQAFSVPLFTDPNGNPDSQSGDVTLEVRTRIWTGPTAETSGTMWPPEERNEPTNLSRTYTWWADSPDDVPITERSQFQGDPRHVPYMDLMDEAGDLSNGYNWFFDSLRNNGVDAAKDHPGLDSNRLRNLWRGYTSFDAPRMLELYRKGLVTSQGVYTTLTGFSYYYMGMGGEIGYDAANGYPYSIPVDLTPYGVLGSAGFINTITQTRTYVRSNEGGSDYWWSIPWLGEIYPDSEHARWIALGNLPAGANSSTYRHSAVDLVHDGSSSKAYGTAMRRSIHRLKEEGCTSFFNTGSSSSTFHHQYSSGIGSLTAVGQQIADNYNFNMPTMAPISRPFGLSLSGHGTVGSEWNFSPYTERFGTSLLQLYYTHPSGNAGSGLVQVRDPWNSSAAYVVVNGIDRTTFIAKYAVLSLIHSFFEAGGSLVQHRILQPPRVEITHPTDITDLVNPSSIDIQINVTWRRWDGMPYTNTGSVTEDENELDYVVMYSNDGGDSWFHLGWDDPAMPGVRPTDNKYITADGGVGPETFSWNTPSFQFPQGSYYLRVDCFRRGAPIHYSYHKTKLFIQR